MAKTVRESELVMECRRRHVLNTKTKKKKKSLPRHHVACTWFHHAAAAALPANGSEPHSVGVFRSTYYLLVSPTCTDCTILYFLYKLGLRQSRSIGCCCVI